MVHIPEIFEEREAMTLMVSMGPVMHVSRMRTHVRWCSALCRPSCLLSLYSSIIIEEYSSDRVESMSV